MREAQVEVLAPAGSFESMKAAVAAGADAVYIGGSRFGARAYADNLDQEKMLEAIDYAHLRGASLYMTVNTLMKEEELGELPRFLEPYYEQGLDGVIVQDLGALGVIRRCFPDLPIHASTQMTITGVYGAGMLAELGVKRVVAARELSLEEIRRIHEEVPIEIECFVHGALCCCYSGQCLLSSWIGARSGNRGRCAQPCRLPYEAGKARGSLLSMKDLCALDWIPDLIEAGACSLKIEGRMKSPRYTAGVVRTYRKYVDHYLKKGRKGFRVDPADRQELLDLFDRGGFTRGYYGQHNGPDMIAAGKKPAFRPGNQKLFDELDRLYVDAEKKEPVEGRLTVREGRELSLEIRPGKHCGYRKEIPAVTVLGQKAETALGQPMTAEQLARPMKKTGNTPFEWERLDICLEGGAFVPVQALNELRRSGLEQLRRAMTDGFKRVHRERPVLPDSGAGGRAEGAPRQKPELHVLLSTDEGFAQVLNLPEVSRVLVEADGIRPDLWKERAGQCHARGKACVLAMPMIFRRQAETYFDRNLPFLLEAGFDGILVRSLEEIGYLRSRGAQVPLHGDHNLYAFNSAARDMLEGMGCRTTTFPLELNSREMGRLGGKGRVLVGYGFMPAMVTAQCVRKNTSGCLKKPARMMMKDRMGKALPVESHCAYCYNMIYNSSALSLIDQRERILELAPEAVRLQFTGESGEEIRQEAAAWAAQMCREDAQDACEKSRRRMGDVTRGHFKRGVE